MKSFGVYCNGKEHWFDSWQEMEKFIEFQEKERQNWYQKRYSLIDKLKLIFKNRGRER